jgi:hypothetical protein
MNKLRDFLFPVPDSVPYRPILIAKLVFIFAILAYSWKLFFMVPRDVSDAYRFIHLVNLVFHEAGHAIFSFLPGRQIMVLGGSLMQCLVPLTLAIAFLLKQRDSFSAGICLWWFGENLADCSPYINDARMLALTLLGGGTGAEQEGHDWEYLLTQWNLLDYDVHIAWWVLKVGKIFMIAGLVWAATTVLLQWRTSDSSSAAPSE